MKTRNTYKRPYELGVIVGRFQILHRGHAEVIRKSVNLCKRTVVLVGSSQESGTLKNPLDFEMRRNILLNAFPTLDVYPLPDIGVGNNSSWGEYVLKKVNEYCGRLPDIMISGKEERRNAWLPEKSNIAELFIPKEIEISATEMIKFIIDGDKEKWESFIEPSVNVYYEAIRQVVLFSKDNTDTKSI